jgi:hypothetical protein
MRHRVCKRVGRTRRAQRRCRSDHQRSIFERLPGVVQQRERGELLRSKPLLHERRDGLRRVSESRQCRFVVCLDRQHGCSACIFRRIGSW